jgi:hypothetical protein
VGAADDLYIPGACFDGYRMDALWFERQVAPWILASSARMTTWSAAALCASPIRGACQRSRRKIGVVFARPGPLVCRRMVIPLGYELKENER